LKSLADSISKQIESGVVGGNSEAEGRGSSGISVTPDLKDRLNAVTLVRAASEVMGGKGGGGRPDMAQAGGPNANADEVFAKLREHLAAS
ncbi:MAG: DHHA1 domain-containing protein, partial [Gluconobacter cerinus]|uniref:DHHA1 domain-containing protein n=1 Tax=Gluconobacter cerinus TaxID=38307 RepID=UPI0039E72C7A